MTIPPEHLVIEADRDQHKGGQSVGLGPTGITITHVSGLKAYCNYNFSQYQNRKIALSMIEWGCAELRFYE